MNLLVLDQFSDLGGAQQCLLEALEGMRDRGWRASVGMPGAGPLFDRVRQLGFAAEPVDCGPYTSGRKSLGDAGRFVWGTPRLARQVRRMAERSRADLIYVNGPRMLPAVALAALAVPVVFHAHSYLAPGSVRRLAALALQHTGASVIGSCRFVAEPWRPFAASVSVMYNGVAGPGAPVAQPDGHQPVLGCIGRIAPEKGQMEFIQAAGIIQRKLPACDFVIYGAALFSEPASAEYDRTVRAAAAKAGVRMNGWAADVYEALSRLDLLLAPSAAHEATTRVILEAYAAGVPVIAFRSGGIPEIVDDGVTGFLVDSSAEMASRAIDLLTGDRNRPASISARAREAWSRRFTLERYRSDVLDCLERAANPARVAC